ncbi:MAG: GPP34 family phosphoprotein, partial [Chloroflexi bacterium]|nr:GPP34 family phosphoprotein [Chloroflexota bacterium]
RAPRVRPPECGTGAGNVAAAPSGAGGPLRGTASIPVVDSTPHGDLGRGPLVPRRGARRRRKQRVEGSTACRHIRATTGESALPSPGRRERTIKLRFAEEIILLLLDDEDGTFARVPRASLDYALAGGVLMELALENRIDTDLDRLVVLDATPLGDDLLDPTLAEIASDEGGDARYWVQRTANRSEEIREQVLARLVERGILERRDERFLWVFRSRRYPVIEGEAEREVKLRIMEVLFSDVIPDPRDVVIISLAHACGIFDRLLSRQEVQSASARIEQVRKLDLISQAMSQVIVDLELSIASYVQPHLY